MKNVYDILVNFKKIPYEFYEWEAKDEIKHIRCIPSFKVSDITIYEITNYDVIVSKEFLTKIFDKTEIFYNRMVKKISYACIFFNDEFCVAVVFDETGKTIGKSKLLFDESDDVVFSGKNLDLYKLDYNVVSKISVNKKFTRKENKIVLLLIKYLDKIYENKRSDELKYIYYECFNKEEKDYTLAYRKLKQSIIEADFNIINELKTLVKVLKN